MAYGTKHLLAESFKKILLKKPIDKITVKELAEDCGVNRQTFYYNFQDIYDLVDWIFDEESKALFIEPITEDNWQENLRAMFYYMQENRTFILNVFYPMNSLMRPVLEKSLKRRYGSMVKQVVESILQNQRKQTLLAEEDKMFIIDMFTVMLIGLTFDWLDNDMRNADEHYLDRLIFLVSGSLKGSLEKFQSVNIL